MNNRIKNIRKVLNLTAKELSEKIGIPYRTIVNYENGTRKASSDFIEALVIHLGINSNWLLTGKGEMFISNNEKENSNNFILEKRPKEKDLEVKGKVVNSNGELLFRFTTEEDIKEVCSLMEYAPPAVLKQIKKKLLEIKKISES